MIGTTILHYKIMEKLGEGGMGVVYLAEDTKLKRQVAIKFLPRTISIDKEYRERFIIEAQTAAKLNHPNVSQIYAIEEADDEIFLVMEFIKGIELKDKIKEGPLPVDDTVNIALQLAKGLQAAHDNGIIHRDIKSSNIMLLDNGEAKVMDFGLAKLSGAVHITQIGVTVGTIAYMPPEQIQSHEVDERADIWSFGVVLYEMLTGRLPFDGVYEQALMYSILDEEPEPISNFSKDIPANLVMVINKCLQKDPKFRFESFSNILEGLTDSAYENELGAEFISRMKLSGRAKPKLGITKLSYFLGGLSIIFFALWLLFPSILDDVRSALNLDSVPDKQHLLILPVNNIGGDSSKQVFCDGLVETLTSKLTQLEQFHKSLWVVPSSEVRRYKVSSPSEAYESFGANLAVAGSFQLIENIFRLTLNLVDAKNLRQINSAVLDIPFEEVAGLHNNSVVKLMEMLNLELNPKAEGIIREGNTTVPEAYEYYIKGKGYLLRYEDEDNLDMAIKLFNNAIDQDPQYALAYSALGESYWQKYELLKDVNYVQKAKEACGRGLVLNDKLSPVNVSIGMIYLGTGEYENAIQKFNKALNTDPTNAAAYRGLAKAYEAEGKLEDAESTYKRAIKLKPDYWAGYNDLGVFYYNHANYENAIKEFKQVTILTPDNYKGFNNLGGIFYSLQQYDEALQMFERSFELKKSHAVASNLGTLYFIEGRFTEAASMYGRALEINDKDYLTWANSAAAYYWAPGQKSKSLNNYKHAVKLAEEMKKINPNDPDVISNLASYYAEIGNEKKSRKMIEQSKSFAEDNVQVMYRLASTYERLKERDSALVWIGKALNNGYSRSEIERQPELKGLVSDKRYKKFN